MYLTEDTLFEVAFADWTLDHDNLFEWVLTNIELIITICILGVFRLDRCSEIPFP